MKTRRFLFFCLLIVANTLKGDTLKVLFIGNSYVYSNNLPLVLRDLAFAQGDTLIVASSAPGGFQLNQHCTYAPTLSAIQSDDWDYVILQEQSQMPSFPPAQVATEVYPFAAQLDSLIKANNPCSRTIFFMTWGRKYGDASNCAFYPPLCTYEGMQMRLRESYLTMGNDNQAAVAPVGMAFRKSMQTDSTLNLYVSDNSHPSVAGTYLAASTIYCSLLGRNITDNSYTGGLNASSAAYLRQIAASLVYDSLLTWHIGEFSPFSYFTATLQGGNPLSFNFSNISGTGGIFNWDFGDGNFASGNAMTSHTYNNFGTYTVKLTTGDSCSLHSNNLELDIIPVPIHSNKEKTARRFFAKGSGIYLMTGTDSNDIYTLTDVQGSIICSRPCYGGQVLSTSLTAGLYIIRGNSGYIQKLTVNGE